MDKKKLNLKKLKKLISRIGLVILIIGLLMIPFNMYYWEYQTGCSVLPSLSRNLKDHQISCWGTDTANILDAIRTTLIILGLTIMISVPAIQKLMNYLYSDDK